MEQSDIVTLHVPLLPDTWHMIGQEQIKIMSPQSILINTARGGLVDDEALAAALKTGKLKGAGLDCVENEELSSSPFKGLENVIITPHVGGTCTDLADEMIPRIASQIQKLIKEGTLNFVVNQDYIKG